MKKLILPMALLCSLAQSQNAHAQAPNLMSYQAVVRSSSNALVANSPVGVKISILQTTATGTAVYAETQTANTNVNGLVTLQIGNGTALVGTIGDIDWSAGPYFIKTETDPTGGTSYSLASTTQMMSVPYALYAEKSGNTNIAGTTNFVSKFTSNTALGNSQIYNDSTGVGINTITPMSKLHVNGQGTVDTMLGDIQYTGGSSNSSRIGIAANNSLVNGTSSNVGVYSNVSGAKNNVAFYGTSSQTADTTASYNGLVIDNYDNALHTYGAVNGIFSDVRNAGNGNANGIQTFVAQSGATSTAVGISNNTSGSGTVTGLDMMTQSSANSDLIGVNNIVAGGSGFADLKAAVNFGDGYGTTTGAQNIALGEDSSAAYGALNVAEAFSSGPAYGSQNLAFSDDQGDAYGADISATGGSFSGTSATKGKTIGTNVLTTGANTVAMKTIGVKVINDNGDNATVVTAYTNAANPAGYFSAIGGSGQGVYAEAVGKGFSDGTSQYGTGVTGVSKGATSANAINIGVVGLGANGSTKSIGVSGLTSATSTSTAGDYAIYGKDNKNTATSYAGYFEGKVFVNGTFTSTGPKPFSIDYPMDPENKILHHFAVEGPEVLNNYSGNITTNASGKAIVQLPDYFESINKDFRYQLTVIGTSAQVFVSKEVANNKFEITTSVPNVKISWQVMGVRNDAYMQKVNTLQAVEEKSASMKGKYLSTAAYNKPASMGAFYIPEGVNNEDNTTSVREDIQKNKQNVETKKANFKKIKMQISTAKTAQNKHQKAK